MANEIRYVPFYRPSISDREIEAVVATLESGWLTTGPQTKRFEADFRTYCQSNYALAVNSCTAALHVALTALRVGPGDEVITSAMTFCATINVILEVGATPVLADIGADLNLDPRSVAGLITERTKAIIPVHMGGLPCDMNSIWELARQYNLRVIEDAAHAAGAFYCGRPVGNTLRSDAVAFSFYATKNMTTGEGGMVTSSNSDLHETMRMLTLHGISKDAWDRYDRNGSWYYEVVARGYKYNMSDIMASLGIEQLRNLGSMQRRRTEIAQRYTEALGDVEELELPANRPDSVHAWHLYIIRLRLSTVLGNNSHFIHKMKAKGVGCSVHFIPIPVHPYYKQQLDLRERCTHALAEYPRLVSIPLFPSMTDTEVSHVIAATRECVRSMRTRRVG